VGGLPRLFCITLFDFAIFPYYRKCKPDGSANSHPALTQAKENPMARAAIIPITPERRRVIEDEIERLIASLDAADGDADHEADYQGNHGGRWTAFTSDDEPEDLRYA
jgi:hypothetical protein